MAEKITLSTGLKTFDLYFADRDETVQISFNPTDKGLAVRFKEAQKRIEKATEKFKDVELDEEGNPVDLDFIDQFAEMTEMLYKELDRAFASPICAQVFKYCSPFAIVDGEYFFLAFFEAITPVIQKYAEAENAKANKKMSKYLDKYGKYIKK